VELFGEHLVLEVRILVEVEVDAVARFNVLELLHLQFVEGVQAFLLLLVQNAGNLRVVDKLQTW